MKKRPYLQDGTKPIQKVKQVLRNFSDRAVGRNRNTAN